MALALFAIATATAGASTPPANDDFASRTVLAGSSAAVLAYNRYATTEAGEPQHGGKAFSRSLWWSWTAPASGWANFSTQGSGQPLIIAVYAGDSMAALSAVGVRARSLEGATGTESVNVPVVAGNTYQIALSALADSPTNSDRVVLGINQAPAIVSKSLVNGVQGESLTYNVTATNGAMSYAATGLPQGLSLNRATGTINGTPAAAGNYDAQVSAIGPGGTATTTVRFVIAPQNAAPRAPEFNSGLVSVLGYVGAGLSETYGADQALTDFSTISLPPGLTTTLSSGGTFATISGIPTQSGTFTTTLKATNAGGHAEALVAFQILEKPPLPLFTCAAVAYGTVGQSFSYYFYSQSVDNDDRDASFGVGALPAGLIFRSTSISGTPTTAGTFEVPVTLTSPGGQTTATLTIVIADAAGSPPTPSPPPIEAPQITSASSALVAVDGGFTYYITATNSPTSYSASGIPAWMSFDPAAGVLWGKPGQPGHYTVDISATNAEGTSTVPLSITVRPPRPLRITSAAAAAAVVGSSFNYNLTVVDSEDGYPFSYPPYSATPWVEIGSLPPGLSAAYGNSSSPLGFAGASITGTPTAAGTYRVPVSATAHGITTNAMLTILVTSTAQPPVITSSSVVQSTVGYSSNFTVLRASNNPTSLSLTNLPPGLSFDPKTGTASGTPTQAGRFEASATATNAAGSSTATITFIIDPAPTVSFSTSGSAAIECIVGKSVSTYVSISDPQGGSTANYTITGLPPEFSVSTSGQITGIPAAIGTFPLDVRVQTSTGTAQRPLTLVVRPVTPPTITSSQSASGVVGESFTYYISAADATTFNATPLPPGLKLSGTTISGTPTQAGNYDISLSATNAAGTMAGHLKLRIDPLPPAPGLAPDTSVRGYLNMPFSYYFYPSGDFTSVAVAGSLPTGITANTGGSYPYIGGTSTQAGIFPLTITATGPGGTVTAPLTLIIASNLPPPVIVSPIFASRSVSSVNYTVSATNSPTSFGAEGLPSGVSINTKTGVISGTPPSNQSSFPLKISATNASGTATAKIILFRGSLGSPTPSFGAAMAAAALNAPFSYSFDRNVTYPNSGRRIYSASGMPPGLSIDPSIGIISGTPSVAGTYAIDITARGYTPSQIVATLTLVVQSNPEPPVLNNDSIFRGAVGAAFSAALTGTNVESYSIAGLPPGLQLDSTTGKITGTPTTAGRYAVKASATNIGGTNTCDLVIQIDAAPALPVFTNAIGENGYVGTSFSYYPYATNSPSRYEADGLPPGLSIDPTSGEIRGIPSAIGYFVVTLRAFNAGGVGIGKLSLRIGMPDIPAITSSWLVEGVVGTSFSYTIYTSDNAVSFSCSDLPVGLALNPNTGLIKGIPSVAGEFDVTVRATNAGGTGTATVRIRILGGKPSLLTSSAGATGIVGQRFAVSLSSSVSGATYAVESLPPGLSFAGSSISGVPAATGTYLVPVHSILGNTDTKGFITLDIQAAPSLPPIITSPLTAAVTLGADSPYAVTASNKPTQIVASNIPTGFDYDAAKWIFTGFPDSIGIYSAEVTATNDVGSTTAQITFLADAGVPPVVTNGVSAFATSGQPVSYPLSLARISDYYYYLPPTQSWPATPPTSLAARGLPPGLYLNTGTKQIEGTPTTTGDYPVEVLAADAFGNINATHILFHVADAATVEHSTEPALKISSSAYLTAAGAVGSPFNLNIWPTGSATGITVTGLPPGLNLAASLGTSNGTRTRFAEITGTPTAPGVYPTTITFTDGSRTASAIVTIHIPASPPPPVLNRNPIAKGIVGSNFSLTLSDYFSYIYRNAPTLYTAENLPPGLNFNAEDHRITGSPTSAGRFTVPISLTNSGGTTQASLTIVIEDNNAGLPGLSGSGGLAGALPETGFSAQTIGYAGQPLAFSLRGENTITDLAVTGLPDSLTLVQTGADTWEIEGTPTETGTRPLLITATNSHGTTTMPLTLDIRQLDQTALPPPPDPTPVPAPTPAPPPPSEIILPRGARITASSDTLVVQGRITHPHPGAKLLARNGAGRWTSVRIAPSARFSLRLRHLPFGSTVVTLRLTDATGNLQLKKIVILRNPASS